MSKNIVIVQKKKLIKTEKNECLSENKNPQNLKYDSIGIIKHNKLENVKEPNKCLQQLFYPFYVIRIM